MLIRTRHAQEARGLELLAHHLRGLDKHGRPVTPRSGYTSRREARGVPCQFGGLDIRRDPARALEDRERDPLAYRDLLGE